MRWCRCRERTAEISWLAPRNSSSRKRALPGVHDEGGADGDNAEEKESGYVGKRLMMQDLEPHFHLGLKEAAAELGVAPTTLKRVCRRLGIPRWPRRTLQKLSKQGDAANAVAVALGKRKEAPVVAQVGVGTPGHAACALPMGRGSALQHPPPPPS